MVMAMGGVAMTMGCSVISRVVVMCAGGAEPAPDKGFPNPLDRYAEATDNLERHRIVQRKDPVFAKAGGAVEIAELVTSGPPGDAIGARFDEEEILRLGLDDHGGIAVQGKNVAVLELCAPGKRHPKLTARSCLSHEVRAGPFLRSQFDRIDACRQGQVRQAPCDGGDDAHAGHRK